MTLRLPPSLSLGLLAAASVILLGLGGAGVAACGGGGGSGGPTGPGGSLCGRVTFDPNQGFSIRTDCQTTATSGSTNFVRDQFGRLLSFNFDLTCTDGSLRLVGRVFNAQYNNIGELLSWQWTINGESCSETRSAGVVASAAAR